ncbi:MAG TPA: secretin N-terminal domain-containing protein [Patescibacteria group bacterium]|nr:secretin N-terminal domain-containing protein [Patescibacteria group bacterium]
MRRRGFAIPTGIAVSLFVLVALVMQTPSIAAPAPPAAAAGLATKTFTAHYKTVDDIVALIQPAIGDGGSYTVQPRIKAVTVTDTPESIRRIEALITGYDLPPRAITLVVQLMRAEEGPPQDKPPRRMGLPPSVIQDVTKWGVVTQLGSASLSTAENESGSVALGEDYRVRFQVGAVTQKIGVIRMERFALERIRRGPDGQPRYSAVMDLVLNLKAGVTTVLGATSSQDSKQALFVSVTATSQEALEQ